MQEVIDHHDSLVRELYHLETTYSTLTYDPSKIKLDHSEKMLLVSATTSMPLHLRWVYLIGTDFLLRVALVFSFLSFSLSFCL